MRRRLRSTAGSGTGVAESVIYDADGQLAIADNGSDKSAHHALYDWMNKEFQATGR